MASRSTHAALAIAAVAAAQGCPRTTEPEEPEDPAELGEDLEAAAMPFRVLAVPGGREVAWDDFVEALRERRAVCVGEQHGNPHHHWAQLQVARALIDEDAGGEVALGMEMFEEPVQGVLDDFAEGLIDEDTMLARTAWEERWGHDYALYRPMVETAVDRGARVLALNAPRQLVRTVSREGFEELSPSERARLPELDLGDAEHHGWFWDVMEALGDHHPRGGAGDAGDGDGDDGHGDGDDGHGDGGAGDHGAGDRAGEADDHGDSENARRNGADVGADPGGDAPDTPELGAGDARFSPGELDDLEGLDSSDRLYAAQVIWDESMAETSAEFLAHGDDRRVVILAGVGHCHDSAIVSRIERRGDFDAAAVMPVIAPERGAVAQALTDAQHDFLFVLEPPEDAGH